MAEVPERSRSCRFSSPVRRRWLALVVASGLSTGLTQAAGTWIPIGPHDIAMVTALSVGQRALYAGTCNGVYRSDDGGARWREAGLQRACVIRVAADPRSDTIYAVVDHNSFVSYYPDPSHLLGPLSLESTIWVSRDGARSWSQTPITSGEWIAVDPTETDTAYVASYDLIYYPLSVTHDSGATWTRIAEVPPSVYVQVDVDPRDGIVYAVAGGAIAVGDGETWTEVPISVAAVGIGTGSDGAVYAAGFQTFCRKTTAAPNWTCGPQAWGTPIDVLEIPATASEGPRILVVGFEGVYVSADAGRSFSLAEGDPVGYTPAIALDPVTSVVYAGNDVGVYRSADRARTWTNSSKGLRSSWVRGLAIDPSDASTIWAGAEGRPWDLHQPVPGLFRSADSGDSWTLASVGGEPGFVFSLDFSTANPQHIFVGTVGSVVRSRDGGSSWLTSSTSSSYVFGVATDPDFTANVWAATADGLKKSIDGGATWSDALADSVYSLLYDSRRPGTIYAGSSWEKAGYYYPFGWGFAIHTSRDKGQSWRRVESENGDAVISLAIDPLSQDVVYAGTYGGAVLRSPDAGATWERWDLQGTGSSVMALAVDAVRSGTLYLGGWGGVLRSTDGGRNWHDFSEGLSPYGVFGLAVSPDGAWLYAGTTGGGVFQRNLLVADRQPPTRFDRPRSTRTVPP